MHARHIRKKIECGAHNCNNDKKMSLLPTPPEHTKPIKRSPLLKSRPVVTNGGAAIMDVSYTKNLSRLERTHFKYTYMDLVELDISGTDIESITCLRICPRLSKLIMSCMNVLYDEEDIANFGLETLSECKSLTHLNMTGFSLFYLDEDYLIDIRPLFSKEFLAQLNTLLVGADTYGNRCPLRWLSMDSITYMLEHAVNVRTLDISQHVKGNLEQDSFKHLQKLEHLTMHGYCEWNHIHDDMEDIDEEPSLPKMSLCPNLKIIDLGFLCGARDTGDIGLCKNLECLRIDLDDDYEITNAVKRLPTHIRVVDTS